VVVEGGARPGETPEIRCTCPNFAGGSPCKHIWATLICIDAADPPVWPQLGDTHGATVDDEDGAEDHHEDVPDAWVSTDDETEPSSSLPTWRRQLHGIEAYSRSLNDAVPVASGTAETWYLLNVSETTHSGAVTIDLCFRTRKKDGAFGKLKPLRISGRGLPDKIAEHDVEIIEILAGNQLGPSAERDYYTQRAVSRVELSPALHDIILPRLCASGRFICPDADIDDDASGGIVEHAAPLVWDEGAPWKFRMEIESDAAAQRWQFTGELYRTAATEPSARDRADEPAEQTAPLDATAALLPTGLVIFRDAIAKLDAADQFAWIMYLRGKAGISIPYSDRKELLRTLYSMYELPRVSRSPTVKKHSRCATPAWAATTTRPAPRWSATASESESSPRNSPASTSSHRR
jgi:hypothetical protein